MSDQSIQGSIITSRLIASIATRTALETPGVLRLEPTIQGFLARLGPAALQHLGNPGSQDGTYRHNGVTVTISDGTARVHLDIATDIAYTALHVAETVQERVRETISHTGLTPGTVDVTIRAIEPHRGATML
ncbi:Asp23/Gls24 family envelope stress response protein [Arthrobacter sp. PsM3]|uniref:Asp23/Gls24 family envelope stress response protein n=1 Tax=Arthrobacter sp. PsM3 TaxID=3030531 RepID=UPI00263A97D8|nr:Asp23/Gls24 family envelope stress response protein [Arthrobacter sp. PsM3]MDN4645184.1 Asp23/Gls24 family envelope stress response protein [Arthrobacter sp. PsM3]